MADVRRRADKPDDDATIPIQGMRGGGRPNQPAPPNAPQYPQYPPQGYPQPPYANSPNAGYYQQPNAFPPGGQPPPQNLPVPPPVNPTPPPQGRRGIPFWLLLTAGGVLGIILIAVVLFLLQRNPGLTLIIRGAPEGSDVFIKDGRGEIRRGVPVENSQFRVASLQPGQHTVVVKCAGYSDFQTSVEGVDGQTIPVNVVMGKGECSFPKEINFNGHQMVLVCAGEFTMGSDTGEPDEKPAHPVSLPDFYIDKFEVSNQKFKEFCDATGNPTPTPFQFYKDLFEKNPTFPVVGVSWFDAKKYAEWRGLRLPTEAEWEKAASWDPQSKTKRIYPWGNTGDKTRGKFGDRNLATIDSFSNGVSAYGVFNMGGNAAEWVEDEYKPYPGSPSSNGFDASMRIARGGSVADDLSTNKARTTYRAIHKPDDVPFENEKETYRTALGFRCAVSANAPAVQAVIRSMGGK